MGWPVVKLEEVLDQDLDFVNDLEPKIYKKLSVKLYGKGVAPDKPVDAHAVRMKKHQIAREGQVIVSEIWAKKGAIGIVPADGSGALCTSHFFLFNRNPERVTEGWLRYLFVANFLELQLSAEARGTTGYASVRPRHFLQCEVPLPPLAEQRRIIAKLDKVAGLVEEASSLRNRVEDERKRLLVNMAHRPDLSTGEKKRCGWRQVELKKILTPAAEACEVDLETRYPNLGIYSFARGAFAKPSIDGASTGAKILYRVRKRQFIYSRLFAFEGAYTIVPDELDGRFVSNEFPSFSIDEQNATPEFLAALFMNPQVWTNLRAGSLGLGSRRQRVNQKHLLDYVIWLPPLSQQFRISEVFGKFKNNMESGKSYFNELMAAVLYAMFHEIDITCDKDPTRQVLQIG